MASSLAASSGTASSAAASSAGASSGGGASAAAFFASSAAFMRSWALALGRLLIGLSGIGGIGMISAAPRNRASRSLGLAPRDSQYLMRSSLSTRRLGWSLATIGSKVPSLSMKRPSRGERASARTMR